MGAGRVGFDQEALLECLLRLVVFLFVEIQVTQSKKRIGGFRIDFKRFSERLLSLIPLFEIHISCAQPELGLRILGVELKCFLEMANTFLLTLFFVTGEQSLALLEFLLRSG